MYTLQVWASGFWYVLFLFWLFLKHFRKLFFLDALGLCCFETAFSSCSEQVYCSLQRMGPTHCWWLLLLQSPSSRHLQQLQVTGFRAWTQSLWCLCGTCCVCMLRGRWNLPGPEIEPISPALADGFLFTAPPGKSILAVCKIVYFQLVTDNSFYPCNIDWNLATHYFAHALLYLG